MSQFHNNPTGEKTGLSQGDIGVLLLMAAIILGGYFRLFPVYMAKFPLNDGGLFYQMTEAIIEGGYRLPEYINYNGLEIPFAYPPFGFYVAALTRGLFNTNLIVIFQYLPAFVLILSIVAFFNLAGALLDSSFKAGIATVIFALLPRSITWLIMGGGVTRSFGVLFLILATLNIYKLLTDTTWKYLLSSIFFSSLVCLSHPEAALHTVGIALLIAVFKVRTKKGLLKCAAVAGGTLVFTSFWWLPVVLRFSLGPYLTAAQTGLHSVQALLYLFISFSEEPFLTIIAVLAIIGFAGQIARRRFLLPILYIIPFVVEPRNATNVASIPMAILASSALTDVIYPSLAQIENRISSAELRHPFQGRANIILSAYLMLTMVIGIYYYSINLVDKKLSVENQRAFDWVARNTPQNSRFLVITGNTDLVFDWTLEWFPALTGRISETTIQGREWIDGRQFIPRVHKIQAVQNCVSISPSLPCLEARAKQLGAQYDYIYIAKKTAPQEYATTIRGEALILELAQANDRFTIVYQNDEVVIFRI